MRLCCNTALSTRLTRPRLNGGRSTPCRWHRRRAGARAPIITLIGSLRSSGGPDARASSTNRPTAQDGKSISALPPRMGTILVWSVFSSVTRPLLSHGLVVRQHPQNTLVRSLVHASRLDRRSAALSPFEPSAQLLDTTRNRP